MKKTLLTALLLSLMSLSSMAVEVSNVNVTTRLLSDSQNAPLRVPFSSTTRDIIVNEDFEAFTAGSVDEPDFGNPLASLDSDISIDPALTHGEQWYGHNIYQAGGALAMQSLSMDQCILNTPRMDYSGSVRLTFLTKAMKSSWIDDFGEKKEDMAAHLIVGISDEQGRKIDINATSNRADLQMYADMGWMEVTIEFDNYSAYNGVSIVFAGTRTLLIDDIKVSVSNNEFIAVPYVTGITDVKEDSFTIHWEKVRKSYNYYVWLYTDEGIDPETGEHVYQIVFPKKVMDMIAATEDYTTDDYIRDMGGIDSPHLKYDIVNRHGDLNYTFTDLDPAKDYCFAVMSHNVSMFSKKNLIKVNELACPELLDATDFTDNSFTANWTRVTKADYYEVALYGANVVPEDDDMYELLSEDFSKTSAYSSATDIYDAAPCTSAMTIDDMTSTPGWEINGPLALEIPDMGDMPLCYMLDGWFGPGMNMTLSSPDIYVANGDFVIVDMLMKCANPGAPVVMQFAGAMYMAELEGNTSSAELVLPTNGFEEARLELACMDQEGLPLFLDHIAVMQPLKKGDMIFSSLGASQVSGDETSITFNDLDKRLYDVYAYTVTAVKNDGRRSARSERAMVNFKDKSQGTSIASIEMAEPVEIVEVARYSLDGRLLNSPVKGVNIVKYSDGSTRKVMVK